MEDFIVLLLLGGGLLLVFFGAFADAWLFLQYGDEHERERERQKKGGQQ